jgi:hypothetical protein
LVKKVDAIIGVNYFKYNNPIDNNNDNFTDLSCRIAFRYFLNLISIEYLKKEFSLVSRYLYDRGGEMQWNKNLEEEAKYMAKVSIPLAMNFSENMNFLYKKKCTPIFANWSQSKFCLW